MTTAMTLEQARIERHEARQRLSAKKAELDTLPPPQPGDELADLEYRRDRLLLTGAIEDLRLGAARADAMFMQGNRQHTTQQTEAERPKVVAALAKHAKDVINAQRSARKVQDALHAAKDRGARFGTFEHGPEAASDPVLAFTPLLGERLDSWLSYLRRESWLD